MPGDLQDPEQYSTYPLPDYNISEKMEQKSDQKIEKGMKLKKMAHNIYGRFITIDELKQKSQEAIANGFDLRKHLVNQEIRMYSSIGKPVDQGDFDWLCNRRGFSLEERTQVYDGLKKVGLADNIVVNRK